MKMTTHRKKPLILTNSPRHYHIECTENSMESKPDEVRCKGLILVDIIAKCKQRHLITKQRQVLKRLEGLVTNYKGEICQPAPAHKLMQPTYE